MKKTIAVILLVAGLVAAAVHAAVPQPRIPQQPKLTITTSHPPGAQPLSGLIRWPRSSNPIDIDELEFSYQPSGGTWEVIPGPYFKVDGDYVVPIVLTDSPRNRKFYRVYRFNPLN